MLKIPTSRKKVKKEEKLNLVPIMDSVFIFIFFLLMSASFLKIYEIGSPIPIVSDSEPPKDNKKPLALTMTLNTSEIKLSSGIPSQLIKTFPRLSTGDFDLEDIHNTLIDIKKKNISEDSIIFEPVGDLTYEDIVKVMDAVRTLNKTDEAIYIKNKDGIEEKIKELFSKIIFSNLMS